MGSAGLVALALGYPLAIAGIFRLRTTFRTRNAGWFAVEVLGTALIVAGWLLRGRPPAAATNGAWLAALVAAWVWTGRRGGA